MKILGNIGITKLIDLIASKFAPKDSPELTGTPTAPTPESGDNSTQVATTEFVNNKADDYLPLTGGSMTGNIEWLSPLGKTAGIMLTPDTDPTSTSYKTNLDFGWNWANRHGAGFYIRSADFEGQPGWFGAYARDTEHSYDLTGRTDGLLTWTGTGMTIGGGTGIISGKLSGSVLFDVSNTAPTIGTLINLPLTYKTKTTASGNAVFETTPFFVYPTNDTTNNGTGFGICTGGALAMGAGESARNLISNITLSGATEHLYLCADGNVYIYTKCDTIANKLGFEFNTNGLLTPPSGGYFNGNATGIRDAGNGTTITAQYSGSGLDSTSWLCCWNGYKIAPIADSKYLHTAGGTVTGRIMKAGVSCGWNKGRDNALIALTSVNGYSPTTTTKTVNGSWEIGAYNHADFQNQLIYTYITDTDYNGTNKVTSQLRFTPENGIILGSGGTTNISKIQYNSATACLEIITA